MKLWLASTDAAFVMRHFELGLFAGVLTNPSMLAAAQRPALDVVRDLCAATVAPVFHQLEDAAVETMQREASRWLDLGHPNLGIKVALTRAGCAVLHWLREQRVELRLATCVPTVTQVLLATALDVPWITPSGSALEKLGGPSKLTLLAEMQKVLDQQAAVTRLIPSFASPAEMHALASVGVRHGFVWDRDVARFIDSPLVQETVATFRPAWQQMHAAGFSV
jgi:hypothetical protein